jgi:hypothetical protein
MMAQQTMKILSLRLQVLELLIKLIFSTITLLISSSLFADGFSVQPYTIHENTKHGDVELLGSLRLSKSGDDNFFGFSGLAYSSDSDVLYAITDRAYLYSFKMKFDKQGKLTGLTKLNKVRLRSAKGKVLYKPYYDSEGLAILNGDNKIAGDERLLVSFERKHRVGEYKTNGRLVKHVKVSHGFIANDKFKRANNGMEAVTYSPKFGVVLAKERSPKSKKYTDIYLGKRKAVVSLALGSRPKSRVTAIEALANDNFLVMERSFVDIWQPLLITLKEVAIDGNKARTRRTLLEMDSGKFWYIDNFEGLASVGSNRYCIISDDNNRAVQKTILSCFAIK